MKKTLKITLLVISAIILSIAIDVICIFTISKPIFAIKENNGDSVVLIYKGLFFDTYNCPEYSVPQIKTKGTKFNCAIINIKNQTTDNKIEVIKPTTYNNIIFNKYLEVDNRTIYLANNIEEIYYSESNIKYTLKEYITSTWQTTDDSINNITSLMEYFDEQKDGGTTIYKSIKYDLTLIKCKTISGNRDIFIGDYRLDLNQNTICQ